MALLMPRIQKVAFEVADGPLSVGNEFDKLVFIGAEFRKAGIYHKTLQTLFEDDRYADIDAVVRRAVHAVSSEMGPLYALADEAVAPGPAKE